MSGALPITTASMSDQSIEASSSARLAASRTRPAIDTSVRAAVHLVWPVPTTAQALSHPRSISPSGEWRLARAQTRFCCRHGPEVACARRRMCRSVHDALSRLTDPYRGPRPSSRSPASAPPEGLTIDAPCTGIDPERLAAGSSPGARTARAAPRRPPRQPSRHRDRLLAQQDGSSSTRSGPWLRVRGSRCGGRVP